MEPININIAVSVDLSDRTEAILLRLLKSVSRQAATLPGDSYAPVRDFDNIDVAEPASAQDVSDEQLRTVVNNAAKIVPPKHIRDVFKEFGISTSVQCPQEKRVYLLRKLEKLVEEWKQ